MNSLDHNPIPAAVDSRAIVPREASTGVPLKGADFERMTRRRFQSPTPKLRGTWWTLRVRQDQFTEGRHERSHKRVRLAPATVPFKEVQKIAAEYLRPINQSLETIGSATNFKHYVETTYIPVALSKMAAPTRSRYQGVLNNYLVPAFGKLCLRDLTPLTLDTYFSKLDTNKLTTESIEKIRTVLSSVLKRAVRHKLLITNPAEDVELPRGRHTPRTKRYVTPELFEQLLEHIAEPYATMVYAAVYTGLRPSEEVGLRWDDLGETSIRIDERCCRGDWAAPKSEASNATIAVNKCVIDRIHRLKLLTVSVRAGRATRKYKVVKSCAPGDLVFQSVKTGTHMRDNNILSRHIKPAARKIGAEWINWRCLRTSHATWLKMAGADVKDAQAQMRHSRASTTLDIYQQFVPESQQRAVDKLSGLSRMVQ